MKAPSAGMTGSHGSSGALRRQRRRPPVRIVHLGLGAFHRAHLARYTDLVDDAREWGIAAFTGRSPTAARMLAAQDCLYTLVERSPDGDHRHVVESIVQAHDGADLHTLRSLVAAPTTAILSLTVTEAGYLLDAHGLLDIAAVEPDVRTLRTDPAGEVSTMPGRVISALDARRRKGSGPIAVVSCDNLAGNGLATRSSVLGTAALLDDRLAAWIDTEVSFVSGSVDRITPRTTPRDVEELTAATGVLDRSPIVTEPFSDWVLSGSFPAGRPDWGRAGAAFVDDIDPFERRKLWLLNGSHSLLAYTGLLRGHRTVADAFDDPGCLRPVEEFWAEAAHHLTDPRLTVPDYLTRLRERFGNTRIEHRLTQIATDAVAKLPLRVVPVLTAERNVGRTGSASAAVLAAWDDFLDTVDDPPDAAAEPVRSARRVADPERTVALLRLIGIGDPAVAALVQGLRRGGNPTPT